MLFLEEYSPILFLLNLNIYHNKNYNKNRNYRQVYLNRLSKKLKNL
nr:MAG TPA: hypothetical protein [Caudoviricetes sp.]